MEQTSSDLEADDASRCEEAFEVIFSRVAIQQDNLVVNNT